MFDQNSRHLNFTKFLEERSGQINKFVADLELDTKKKGHQSLPKSIRRRAMSHNRYRIPHRLRQAFEPDLIKAEAMQKLPKCRKHIRKRRHLIMAYKQRHSKIKWLSTHLWAAKRMRLISSYGYRIAYTPNDKCFRSAYRHFRHNCCLVDLSYYQCLSIYSPTTGLPSNIKIQKGQQRSGGLSQTRIYDAKMYSDKLLTNLVCPLWIIRHNQQEREHKYSCFFHPACLEQVQQIAFGPQFSIKLQHNRIDIYALLGPQSTNIANSALKKGGYLSQDQNLHTLENPQHSLQYFTSKEQSSQKKPLVTLPQKENLRLKKEYSPGENTNLRFQVEQIIQKLNNKRQGPDQLQTKSMKHFWAFYESGQNLDLQDTNFQFTTRSKYTHKRKNKLTKSQKKNFLDQQKEKDQKNKFKNVAQETKQQPLLSKIVEIKPQNTITITHGGKKQQSQGTNPLMLSSFQQNNMLKGCLIFGSNADSCKLWRILTHENVKVVGRRELIHFYFQAGCLSFPEDYANTKSFKDCHEQKNRLKFAKFLKFPAPKRPHYSQISSPFPFGCLQHFPDSRTHLIKLEMVSRGKCFEGSYICRLKQTDLKFLQAAITGGKIASVCQEALNKSIQQPKTHDLTLIKSQFSKSTPIREIIGCVTTGGFLFSQSRQGGIGFINYIRQIQLFDGYVLVRKPSSRHYMLGRIISLPQ